MASVVWHESRRYEKCRSLISLLLMFRLIIHTEKLFEGFGVNGQKILEPVEALSSPSHINATKGSSVWLHWNYTYIGDGTHNGTIIRFMDQIIVSEKFPISTSQTFATKFGQNGAFILSSTVSAPFTGRLEIIPSNNTLVINNIQYNDSSYQFLSRAYVFMGGTSSVLFNLKPVVSITVYGTPGFTRQPPPTLDVDENAALRLTVQMDANPRPSVDFEWSHLGSSSITNVQSVELSPFTYSAAYSISNIPSGYCGSLLQTRLKNSIGSSITKSTNVTVSLKLDNSFNLRAERLSALRCVEVRWNKVQSGACYVKYNVTLKDASGANLYSEAGYNIRRIKMCHISTYNSADSAEMIVSFRNASKNITASVSDKRTSTGMIHGVSLVALIQSFVVCLCWLISNASF